LELHHRFWFLPFSRYFRREPEVYADAPFRVGPGEDIPVTLLIKDAHRFPIHLEKVAITIHGGPTVINHDFEIYRDLNTPWFDTTFTIPQPATGTALRLSVAIHIKGPFGRKVIHNHNVPTSPPFDLDIFTDPDPLPGSSSYWWGDLHYHSHYTEDFVEFGASLPATKKACRALGLDFLAITDHSYDLDDRPGSWTETDPNLQRWYQSREEIAELNHAGGPILIPAEEVTSRNHRDQNVHTLVYDFSSFIPGSGDGAENPFRTRSEHSIEEIASKITNGHLVIAAHPRVRPSRLECILLNRGIWEDPDRKCLGAIHGFQILNGRFDKTFKEGLNYWIRGLLAGEKRFIYAGNDAHGNFNAYHQISLPMWSTKVHRNQILGQCRTGILKLGELSLESVITQLKNGRAIITDGPAIELKLESENTSAQIGDSITSLAKRIVLNLESSSHWGTLKRVRLYYGEIGNAETILLSRSLSGYEETIEFSPTSHVGNGYYRAWVETEAGRQAYTNPIWVQ